MSTTIRHQPLLITMKHYHGLGVPPGILPLPQGPLPVAEKPAASRGTPAPVVTPVPSRALEPRDRRGAHSLRDLLEFVDSILGTVYLWRPWPLQNDVFLRVVGVRCVSRVSQQ